MTMLFILAFPFFLHLGSLSTTYDCTKLFRVRTELSTTDSSFSHEKKYLEILSYPDVEIKADSFKLEIKDSNGHSVYQSNSLHKRWNFNADTKAGSYYTLIEYKLDTASKWSLFQERLTLIKVDCEDWIVQFQ